MLYVIGTTVSGIYHSLHRIEIHCTNVDKNGIAGRMVDENEVRVNETRHDVGPIEGLYSLYNFKPIRCAGGWCNGNVIVLSFSGVMCVGSNRPATTFYNFRSLF